MRVQRDIAPLFGNFIANFAVPREIPTISFTADRQRPSALIASLRFRRFTDYPLSPGGGGIFSRWGWGKKVYAKRLATKLAEHKN